MKNVKDIFLLIKPWIWSFVISSLLLIVGIFFRMLEPKIFQVAIDYVVPIFNPSDAKIGKGDAVIDAIILFLDKTSSGTFFSMLLLLAALYLVISIIRSSFVFSAKAINAKATEDATERLRNDLFGHIQRLPMNYFSEISTGELIQRSTGDIETIRRFIGNQLVEVLRLTAIFAFSSYWLFKGNLVFGFISICATPFIAISAVLFFKKEQKVWKEHEDEADKLNAITQENIAGIRVVKAFAQEDEEKKKFAAQNERKLKVALNHAKLHTIFWPLSDFLVHGQIILSVLVGGYMVLMQTISLGELVSFYTYIVMVAWPLRQVGRTLSEMGMALVAMDRIKHIADAKEESNVFEPLTIEQLESLEFREVWFKYPKEDKYALAGMNLKIEKGQTVVLLGPTGSGKSTLVKLLLRFYDLEKGQILVNGIDIVKMDKAFLRRKIGLVLQDAFLFTETVGGNIAYAQKEAGQQEILDAAAWSSLLEVETIFSDGYNTMVGEKGVTLSGGQKQRVSLARTLLQNPDILILDDVTSAVDTGTEGEILKNIEEQWRAKTTLIISHRLTVVPFADKIVVMENGKVSAYGNHEDVLGKSNFYKQIHAIQNVLESEIEDL
jgi:ATP-binding cassette subfamily B protein